MVCRYFLYLVFLKFTALNVLRFIKSASKGCTSVHAVQFAEASTTPQFSGCHFKDIVWLDISLNKEESILHFFEKNQRKEIRDGKNISPSGFTGYSIIFDVPFCIVRYTNRKAGEEPVAQTGLPINEGVSKIEIYHCNGEAKLLFVATRKNPEGDWYRKDPGGNNWVNAPIIRGISPSLASECVLRKLISDAGCGSAHCVVDISKKEQYGNIPISVHKIDKPDSYTLYTHTPSEYPALVYRNTHLKYKEQNGEYSQIPGENIREVSVYCWKESDKPLVLETKGFDGTIAYYKNLGEYENAKWLRAKEHVAGELLDDVNCKINSVVTLNLSFENSLHTSMNKQGYCCSMCSRKKIKVAEENFTIPKTSETLTSYRHTIDYSGKIYKINYRDSKTKNLEVIHLPDLSLPTNFVSQISVYYCSHNPVLIHMKNRNRTWKWYIKSGSTWRHCNELSDKVPEGAGECTTRIQFTKILQGLGCAFREGKCTSPLHKVKMDISKKPSKTHAPGRYKVGSDGTEVLVSQTDGPAGFNQVTHKTAHVSFKLTEIDYKTHKIGIDVSEDPVSQLDVFYWKDDVEYTRPLVTRISKVERGEKWYENASGDKNNKEWTVIQGGIKEAELTDGLRQVNCKVNNTYTLDLSKTETYASNCVTITVQESDDVKGRLGYTRYIHSTPKKSFNIVDLINVPPNMILSDLVKPVPNVHRLHVFHPDTPKKPMLLYVETADQINSKWYGKEETGHLEL